MNTTKRLCLWSGPRNISTALMYSFAQRSDTKVFDEPLYGYYLSSNKKAQAYHPGAEDILASMETDGNKVIQFMMTTEETPLVFFKNMTHHLLGLDWSFMKDTLNIMLTRDPKEMLPSFDKVIPNPTIEDVGYKMQGRLLDYYLENQIPFVVIEARQFLLNPEEKLKGLCHLIDVPFQNEMLSWKAQPRPEDGIWAKYWYRSVHESEGFTAYKHHDKAFPEHLKPLLKTSQLYYNELLPWVL